MLHVNLDNFSDNFCFIKNELESYENKYHGTFFPFLIPRPVDPIHP